MRKALALSAICLCGTAAQGETISSAYSSYDLNDPSVCRQVEPPSEGFGGASLCEGYDGLFIYNADGDARALEAYGSTPASHCAARQTFIRFNNTHTTVEWRLAGGKPFATIVRWYVVSNDEGTATKSWLAVTKLEDNDSCRVALIEGSLPEANIKAREAADTLARDFNCATDIPKVIAKQDIAIEELLSGVPCASQQ